MTATAEATRPRLLARGVLGLLVLIAACWATLLLTVPAPAGDPVLVAVSPTDGELVKSPEEVRITFDRPVPAGLATVHMTVPAGQQVVEGRPYAVSGDPNTLAVRMPPTRYAGTYSVAWSVPSSTLEPVTGTSAFQVFAPTKPVALPQIPTDRDPAVVAIHTGFRMAATAAFALGVGVAFVLAAVWPAGAAHVPARRPITYAWWALVVATLGTIVSFGGYAARLPRTEAFEPTVVAAAFGSDVGAALLVRLLVLAPITIALVQLLSGTPAGTAEQRRLRAGGVLGGAAALAATWNFAKPHGPDGPSPLAVGAETVLLLAIAVCVGGPVLLWVLVRTAGDSVLRIAVPRLARVMPVGGVALLVIAPLTTTGWQLIALLVLAALVVGTGLAGGWWARRRESTRGRDLTGRMRLRRLAAVAVSAVAVALLAAAVPATGPTQLAQSDGAEPVSGPER
jgi:methionine-rich copper-binding protein CopC